MSGRVIGKYMVTQGMALAGKTAMALKIETLHHPVPNLGVVQKHGCGVMGISLCT
jgi:hypothetical protein